MLEGTRPIGELNTQYEIRRTWSGKILLLKWLALTCSLCGYSIHAIALFKGFDGLQ